MTNERRRLKPEERKQEILKAALKISIKMGFQCITRFAVAKEARITEGLLTYYYKISQLKKAVLKEAIKCCVQEGADVNEASIVAQAILVKHPLTETLSSRFKEKIISRSTIK